MFPFFSRMFPGTNLQDLNLDWIVRRIMELSKGIIAPWINAQNQHWMVYDTAAETFVDSGVSAAGEGTGPQGEPGKSPVIGINGNWYTWDTTTQAYTDTGIHAEGPVGPIGPEGPQGPIGDGIAAADYAIVIDGNTSAAGAVKGQYVYLKNSTITGKADGLYKAAIAIPANTPIDSTYLSARLSNGGLNSLDAQKANIIHSAWTNHMEVAGAKSCILTIGVSIFTLMITGATPTINLARTGDYTQAVFGATVTGVRYSSNADVSATITATGPDSFTVDLTADNFMTVIY